MTLGPSFQNLVSGTARLSGTLIIFIQLAFGSYFAAELISKFDFVASIPQVSAVPYWTILVAVAVSAVSLVPLFSARKQDTGWFLVAALSAFSSVHLVSQMMGPFIGAFAGAITVGLIAKLMNKFFDVPGAMIIMPGFIILVPGAIGYRSILSLVDNNLLAGLSSAMDVALIGISLVAGFLISSLAQLPKDDSKDQY